MDKSKFGSVMNYLNESNSDEEDFLRTMNTSIDLSSEDSATEIKLLALLEPHLEKTKRNSITKYFSEVVPNYTEREFIKHFRVNRSVYNLLSNRFENSPDYKKLQKNNRVKSAAFHICVFLWFAGHEACSFTDLADRFNIATSTVHAIIKRVTYYISSLSAEFIVWPNEMRRKETAKFFEEEKGLSDIIGCIDGTYIVINPPNEQKDEYINRKGDYTIHLQGICDERRKFIDVFIGYPGSVHDARVFKNSFVYKDLRKLCHGQFILGDSAYRCSENILTPFRDNGHLTQIEKCFNVTLSSCHVVIEHTFGILKQRFRQLYYCKLQGIEYLCNFIRACCVYYN